MLVSSLRIEWYATWPTLSWPDLWPKVKLWPWPLRSNWVSFNLSRREEHNGSKIDALDLIGQKLLKKKNICAKNWCLTSVNFDLWSLNRWPEVKYEATILIDRSIVHLLVFFRLSLSIIVWAPERINWSHALFTGKCEHFAMMTSFNLENISLESPNLHLVEFLYGPTYPASFVFLAFTGA